MKVIELLERIAKNENIPKIIIFDTEKYIWEDKLKEYRRYPYDNALYYSLYSDYDLTKCLNDEVYEVVEISSKIIDEVPEKLKKLDIRQEKNIKNNWKWKIEGYCVSTPMKIIGDKVNEIIERIKKDENN